MQKGKVLLCLVICLAFVSSALAGQVSETTAWQVAQNFMVKHIAIHHDWNGSQTPKVASVEVVNYEGEPVAYLVTVTPSGHLLVAYYDDFSPVLFYSPISTLDPAKANDKNALESWIIPEIYDIIRHIQGKVPVVNKKTKRVITLESLEKNTTAAGIKIAAAWKMLGVPPETFTAENGSSVNRKAEVADQKVYAPSVGPLLKTEWCQGYLNGVDYYNEYTPADIGCAHSDTGCVATAMAQAMKYWDWPKSGVGRNSYIWNGTTLSSDFSSHTYDWASMPDIPSPSDTLAQREAVSLIMYDAGIAINTDYGCSSSSAYTDNIPNSLAWYFIYKRTAHIENRSNYTSIDWMNLIESELNAATPRVILLGISSSTASHEVVIDGYQNLAGSTQVHLSYGYSDGYLDDYYDITNNWTAFYTWYGNEQDIIIGIEPDNGAYSKILTVTLAGSGRGIVTASTGNLYWQNDSGTTLYDPNTSITLTAAANAGSTFTGWSGACSSQSASNTCVLTMKTDETVTANFSLTGTAPFSDVPAMEPFASYIEAILNNGITTGCGNGDYCPGDFVTRDQMAAFLVRATQVSAGESTTNFTCTGGANCATETPYFSDVPPTDQFFPYVQKLKELGITTGCGNGNYCPNDNVTRDQMAAFLIRALSGGVMGTFTCAGGISCANETPYFTDVPATDSFFPYVQKLKELGITTGCGNGDYCPDDFVTRDQMAAFLARAFLGMK